MRHDNGDNHVECFGRDCEGYCYQYCGACAVGQETGLVDEDGDPKIYTLDGLDEARALRGVETRA